MNRREFVARLIALGAVITLAPDASTAEVDIAWTKLLDEPWFFYVSSHGTIMEPEASTPRYRRDIFEVVGMGSIDSPEQFIEEVRACEPLTWRLAAASNDERDDLLDQLAQDDDLRPQREERSDGDTPLSAAERAAITIRAAAIADEHNGWMARVRLDGMDGLAGHKALVEAWLNAPVDWSETDWFPDGWSGQGRALLFFQELERATARTLGVVIIEGEFPGSTYYAAELRKPVDDANATASRLGLPFRFRAGGD